MGHVPEINGDDDDDDDIIARPQNHCKSAVTRLTKSCEVCFRSESIVPYLERRRTETTHRQQVGHYESRVMERAVGEWPTCTQWRVHLEITSLKLQLVPFMHGIIKLYKIYVGCVKLCSQ